MSRQVEGVGMEQVALPSDLRRSTKLAVIWIIALNGADLISTYWGLSLGAHEGNPLARMLIESHGIVLAKILVCALAVWGTWYTDTTSLRRATGGWFVVGLMTMAVVNNMIHVAVLSQS